MEYTIYELLFFLFCYSFIGWCGETLFVAVRRGHFHNRGVFGVPFSLSYGIMMDLLILVLPTLKDRYLLQVVAYMVITSACAQLAGEFSNRMTKAVLWKQEEHSVYAGKGRGFLDVLGHERSGSGGNAADSAYALLPDSDHSSAGPENHCICADGGGYS